MAGEDNGSGNGITKALSRLWNGNGGSEEDSPVDWFKLVCSGYIPIIASGRHTRVNALRDDSQLT